MAVNIKILGISGSPIKGGNCDVLVQEALNAANEVGGVVGGVETELISLADKNLTWCKHCQWCMQNRQSCKIKDDLPAIEQKIVDCDGLILGGPTWKQNIAPPLLVLFSRFRYITFMTHKFRNKVLAGITLGYFGLGMERALMNIEGLMPDFGIYVGGAAATASTLAFGQRVQYLEHGVLDNTYGVKRVRTLGIKVVEIARMIKYAKEAGIVLPDQYTLTPTGARLRKPEEKVFVDGVWREKK